MDITCPKVSVILPCRNESSYIEECLSSLFAQEQPEGGLEIIVADGMSDDGTREILLKMTALHPNLRVIDNPGKIASSGLNVAIRAAKGAVIVRMDAHTEYAVDYVVQCLKTLSATGADNVGGPARTKAEGYIQRAIAAAYHTPCVVGGGSFHDSLKSGWVDTVTYGCWHLQSFEKFGFFDEELVRNQDDEHNLRISRMGGRIWQSTDIRSWYYPRSSLKGLFYQYFQYGYWKVRVIQKHHLPASIRHLIPGLFVLSVITFAVIAVFSHYGRLLLGLDLVAYGCFLSLAACQAARKGGLDLLPVLPVVIVTYQISYGLGFILGFLDFVIMRRRGRCQALTR